MYSFFEEATREELVLYLDEKLEKVRFTAIIVFDNKMQAGGFSYLKNIQIFFTQNQSADEYIIESCRYKKNKTVVTCDKKLQNICRDFGAKIISCEDFLMYLQKRKKKDMSIKKDSKEHIDRLEEIFEKRYKKLEKRSSFPKKSKK